MPLVFNPHDCPSEDCPYCTGDACGLCGDDPCPRFPDDDAHDVLDRHEGVHPATDERNEEDVW